MWKESQSTVMPESVDNTSSNKYVYVRRNIREINTEDTGVLYIYEEYKIPKDVYEIFKNQMDVSTRVNDIEEVITEIIGGGL
jgi:hypothetical protein